MPASAHTAQPAKPTKSGMVRLSSRRSGSISKTAPATPITSATATSGPAATTVVVRKTTAVMTAVATKNASEPSTLFPCTMWRRPHVMPTSADSGSAIASV